MARALREHPLVIGQLFVPQRIIERSRDDRLSHLLEFPTQLRMLLPKRTEALTVAALCRCRCVIDGHDEVSSWHQQLDGIEGTTAFHADNPQQPQFVTKYWTHLCLP